VKKTSEEYSLLYDYYGALLSARQREVYELYHEEDYSLSEIAGRLGVSRQAVHIALGKADRDLGIYEQKLGLIEKSLARGKAIGEAEAKIGAILKDKERAAALGPDVAKDLRRVRKLIKELDI